MKTFFQTIPIHLRHYVCTIFGIKRPIQQVLNVTIENGFYSENSTANSSKYMCEALAHAYKAKYITQKEFSVAHRSIAQYLEGYFTLSEYLYLKQLPRHFSAKKQIYQNWEARP